MRYFSCFLSILLTGLLVTAPMRAESPATTAITDESAAALTLRVLNAAGQPAEHSNISALSTSRVMVEVTDPSGKPVPDAAVALRFPDAAPSATFVDGSRAAVGYTDQAGRAQLPEIHWEATPGTVAARLTASSGTAHAGLLMEETIIPQPPVVSQPVAASVPVPVAAPPRVDISATPLTRSARLRTPAAEAPEPGQPASAVEADPAVQTVDATNVPLRHMLSPAGEAPSISITSSGPHSSYSVEHSSKTKWIIIIAAAAGAGAAFALLHKSSAGSSTSSSGVTVGAPTLNIGHP